MRNKKEILQKQKKRGFGRRQEKEFRMLKQRMHAES
jgi:hypothetical protein